MAFTPSETETKGTQPVPFPREIARLAERTQAALGQIEAASPRSVCQAEDAQLKATEKAIRNLIACLSEPFFRTQFASVTNQEVLSRLEIHARALQNYLQEKRSLSSGDTQLITTLAQVIRDVQRVNKDTPGFTFASSQLKEAMRPLSSAPSSERKPSSSSPFTRVDAAGSNQPGRDKPLEVSRSPFSRPPEAVRSPFSRQTEVSPDATKRILRTREAAQVREQERAAALNTKALSIEKKAAETISNLHKLSFDKPKDLDEETHAKNVNTYSEEVIAQLRARISELQSLLPKEETTQSLVTTSKKTNEVGPNTAAVHERINQKIAEYKNHIDGITIRAKERWPSPKKQLEAAKKATLTGDIDALEGIVVRLLQQPDMTLNGKKFFEKYEILGELLDTNAATSLDQLNKRLELLTARGQEKTSQKLRGILSAWKNLEKIIELIDKETFSGNANYLQQEKAVATKLAESTCALVLDATEYQTFLKAWEKLQDLLPDANNIHVNFYIALTPHFEAFNGWPFPDKEALDKIELEFSDLLKYVKDLFDQQAREQQLERERTAEEKKKRESGATGALRRTVRSLANAFQVRDFTTRLLGETQTNDNSENTRPSQEDPEKILEELRQVKDTLIAYMKKEPGNQVIAPVIRALTTRKGILGPFNQVQVADLLGKMETPSA